MPDDLDKIAPEDPRTISSQEHELKYWSDKWEVSVEDIIAAKIEVGNKVGDIAQYLRTTK